MNASTRDGSEPADDLVDIDGLRLHVREWGPPAGRPLVLLHGGGGHARSWDSLAAALAHRRRVLAIDQRGHGESGWASSYSTAAMVEDLRAVVSALRLGEHDLLGHSMGGMNAIVHAGARPVGLRRLVVIDIGPDVVPDAPTRPVAVGSHPTFADVAEACSVARAERPGADESELWHRTRQNLVRTVDGRWTWRHDPAIAATIPPASRDEVWAKWCAIDVPILLVRGEQSALLTRESAQRMIAANGNARLVEIAGAGHSVPLDAPDELAAQVADFLDGRPPMPRRRAIGIDDVFNGRSSLEGLLSMSAPSDEAYMPCAESRPPPSVPRSDIVAFPRWAATKIFAGTERDLWVSVPAVDRDDHVFHLIVFQDGATYLDEDGPVRAVAVLDSLMASGELPPTVGVFVMPGDRSLEYDTPDATYGRFLLEELLPFVEHALDLRLWADPRHRTTCGFSSGAVAAFCAAWHHPDAFGNVVSHCGSFVDARGADAMAAWVRTTPRRPLKVYLQTGEADLRIPQGTWSLANQMMADALDYAGYDHLFELGTGGHSLRHGGARFADTLRWLAHSPSAARTTADDAALLEATHRRHRALPTAHPT